MPIEIRQWNDIEEQFTDGLLLGNGASCAVHNGFRYDSLFGEAKKNNFFQSNDTLARAVADIFERFKKDDFEYVLRKLWQAKQVNAALEISCDKVDEAYKAIRYALIKTVRHTHVSYRDAEPQLTSIYQFMKQFKTVVSLNYDLIVYWARMLGNKEHGNWFKDCFQDGYFIDEWQDWNKPYKAQGSSLFFFPHGNLMLANRKNGKERKLKVPEGAKLLNSILNSWESEGSVPLFVCEGCSDHKKLAIQKSPYLHRIYREVLNEAGPTLVIYGWSMSPQDDHLFEKLKDAKLNRIAVSVYQNDQAFAQQAFDKLREIHRDAEIIFFDSKSPGCWNNPTSEEVAVDVF